MASPPYPDLDMYGPHPVVPLSEHLEEHFITSGDPLSISYIPRAAASVPHPIQSILLK